MRPQPYRARFVRLLGFAAVALAAAAFGVYHLLNPTRAISAGQPAFRVITYFNKTGPPIGLLEGTPGVFYSFAAFSPYPVFSVTPQGTKNFLASFSGSVTPQGPLVTADNTRLYSEIYSRSPASTSVFSVAISKNGKQIYTAQAVNPAFTQNLPDGKLFGTASGPQVVGGRAQFLVTGDLQGNVSTVYEFPSGESPVPYTAVYATDGNYYGVSLPTSAAPYVYRVSTSGSPSTVYTFPTNTFNASYSASLIQGRDGNLYGTAPKGGSGYGSIYRLTLSGQFTQLYSFPASPVSFSPEALLEASDGNLYGMTIGTSSQLFRVTKSGAFTVVQTLNAYKQGECYCWLIQGSDGNLYGTATLGGISGGGDVFTMQLGLPIPKPVARRFQPNSGAVGAKVRIWGQNLLGASSVQFNGTPATTISNSGPNYVWATVPTGATSGPLTITTPVSPPAPASRSSDRPVPGAIS